MRTSIILAPLLGLLGCGDEGPALTEATELTCPTPGALPFRLESRGFVRDQNASLAKSQPRAKGEASDTLGNPGGQSANTYLNANDSPSADLVYRGAAARSLATNGLFTKPLPGERVSLWTYDEGAAAWSSVGRTETDENGMYELPIDTAIPMNGQPVYAMLEADGSCAEHYVQLLPRGAKVVITDIDGTLTTDDAELFTQITDAAYVPKMKIAADALLRAWASKGYPIVYLTARPHVLRGETRQWLRDLGFPIGPVITASSLGDADGYKTPWVKRLLETFGWVPVAAYGNAGTDISAYANASIPKNLTFIIGELAGSEGTVAIPNNDYTMHINTFVMAQPANQ